MEQLCDPHCTLNLANGFSVRLTPSYQFCLTPPTMMLKVQHYHAGNYQFTPQAEQIVKSVGVTYYPMNAKVNFRRENQHFLVQACFEDLPAARTECFLNRTLPMADCAPSAPHPSSSVYISGIAVFFFVLSLFVLLALLMYRLYGKKVAKKRPHRGKRHNFDGQLLPSQQSAKMSIMEEDRLTVIAEEEEYDQVLL